MNIYSSKSSTLVKTITIGTLCLLTILIIACFANDPSYSQLIGIVVSFIGVIVVIYFYAISLDKILVNRDTIILKKVIGEIIIPVNDITFAKEIEYSNLSMTYGSKGVFGFIGNTMDNSISLVKDRKNMILLETRDKRYIFSSESSKKLVFEINEIINSVRYK